jgi:two-component system nitrogen regulation response regulator GlnG
MQRALVMAKGDVILPGDLPALVTVNRAPAADKAGGAAASSRPAEEQPADLAALTHTLFQWARENPKLKILPAVERELIIQALLETNGNQVRASKLLGITRATLRKRVEKFQIKQELAIQ